MKRLIGIAPILGATTAFSAPPHVSDGRLVDEHGMTLYVFGGQGAPDPILCEGDRATNFPPALASPGNKPPSGRTRR